MVKFSFLFSILLVFKLLLGLSSAFGQELTQEEIERGQEIRKYLIEEGYLSAEEEFPLAYSMHEESLIVNSTYTGKNRSVATSGTRGTTFRADGRRMYVVGRVSENIIEYHLSTPWDVSTASYVRELDISPEMGSSGTQFSVAHGLYIRQSDGLKLWVLNRTEIWEYTLSTPWDISSASQSAFKNLNTNLVRGHGVYFRSNGTRMYIDDRVVEVVFQYNLSTAWDISTANLDYALDISDQQEGVRGLQLNPSGNRLYLNDTVRQRVLEYHLPNQHDLRSGSFIGSYTVRFQSDDPRNISFNSDFDEFYISDATDNRVYQYRIQYADPVRSALSANRSKVIADGINSSRVTVVIRDSDGNRLQGINVNLRSSNSAVTISAVNRSTNSNGEARFDVSSSTEGEAEFTATATGNTINQTASVTFTSVSASESGVASNREKVIANGTAVSRITVTARDADGDALAGVRMSLSANSNNVSIRNVRRDTDTNGEAIFEVSSSVIEPVRFTASGLGTTINQTAQVRFVGVDPGESNVLSSRQKVLANGSANGRIIVIARDEDGDQLEGVRISLNANSNNAQISAVNRDTDSNGEAVFEVRNSVAEQVRFTASSMGQTISQTQTVRFVTVAPEQSFAEAEPQNVQANGSEQSRIRVTVKDEDGDLLEGAQIELQAVSGSSEIDNPEKLSDQDGEAEFRVTNRTPEILDYRIIAEGIEFPQTIRVGFIPVAPVVLSANNVQERQFTANWEVVSGADRYLIDVSPDSSFENTITIYDSFDTGNATSLVVDNGIEPGRRYLYRVRAAISDLIGAYSQLSQVFTFPDIPQAAAADNRNALVFRANWAAAEGAENYRLDVARDSGFDNLVTGYRDINVGNETSFVVDGLEPGQTYFYRVRSEAGPRISRNSNSIQTSTLAISPEQSVVESSQLRVLANGNQTNQIEITVKSDDGQPLKGLDVQLTPKNGDPEIRVTDSVTDDEGKARFGVTSNLSGKVTFEVIARGIFVGELTVEFIQDDGILVLGDNFPNPFLHQTSVPVTVPRAMEVRIVVYNSVGVPVRTVIDETVDTGYYEFRFDGSGLAAGVYFYRLFADGEIKTGKMVLVR